MGREGKKSFSNERERNRMMVQKGRGLGKGVASPSGGRDEGMKGGKTTNAPPPGGREPRDAAALRLLLELPVVELIAHVLRFAVG